MIKKILRDLLSLFGYWPYALSLVFLRFIIICTRSQIEIWPRNSYQMKTLEPGYSDLDLTLFVKDGASVASSHRFFYIYKILQKVLPFLGELNVYNKDLALFVSTHHNYFELSRDPIFFQKFHVQKKPDFYEGAVFLFRQLEKDVHNLVIHPKKRLKKWKSHLEMINQAFPDENLLVKIPIDEEKLVQTIIAFIVHLCGCWNPIFSNEMREKLDFYLALLEKKVVFEKLNYLPKKDSWFISFIGIKFSDLPAVGTLNNDQVRFLVKQIEWEFCGVLSQILIQNNVEECLQHLQKILLYIEKMNFIDNHKELEELCFGMREVFPLMKEV